jgi:DNA-binding transcriptional regulator YdaS (Cro superfamily)
MSDAVVRAIHGAGGLGALAKALGISYQAVQKWRRSGIPAERVLVVEKLSGISRSELRPDLYPPESPPSRTTRPIAANRRRA